MNGVLLVDKPRGITSHDVVDLLRKKLQIKKAGHAGTLDPEASGLLIMLLGRATKKSSIFLSAPKTYEVICRLGIATDTDDKAGEVILTGSLKGLTAGKIGAAVKCFEGDISQVVPKFSAVKVGGRKLYEFARKKEAVALPEKKVTIHNINIRKIDLPYLEMEVNCSKGTYIRSLCRDIGSVLGCGGCVWQLRRTTSEPFKIEQALCLEKIKELPKDVIVGEIIEI